MLIPLGRPEATANISGGELAPDLTGTVKFYRMGRGCLVVASVSGLPQNQAGFFGFHIHKGSGCTGAEFSDTGSHYDPTEQPHPGHAGDLPPLLYCDGSAFMAVRTDRFAPEEVVGKTVVIHNMPDDFRSQPAGNAGLKIGCGVITA